MPIVEPLCSSSVSPLVAEAAPYNSVSAPSDSIQIYFEEALACLEVLRPFADDNVDCSIICRFTRKAVEYILLDPTCSHLDQTALTAVVDLPMSTKFFDAKEYLNRCLTLCHISNVVN
jgi:hypothetical protein